MNPAVNQSENETELVPILNIPTMQLFFCNNIQKIFFFTLNFLLLSLKRDQFCWVKYVSKITGFHGRLFNTVVAKILDNWQASVILPKKIISFRLFQLCVYCKKDHYTFHWVLLLCFYLWFTLNFKQL